MTRADVIMTSLPGLATIGFRHRRLRDLGDGWQILDTSGANDPPNLETAVSAAAERWNAPVLGVYIADCCAQVHGAAPGRATWSGHLPDATDTECGMVHRPPVSPGGTLDDLEAHMLEWAGAAGLKPSTARLSRALRYLYSWSDDSDGPYIFQFEQIYELVRAFGLPILPEPRPYAFDPHETPLAKVTTRWGLAALAREAATSRANGGREDEAAIWEEEALALESDVFASLYGGGHPLEQLNARAEWINAAYRAAREGTPPPERIHDLGSTMISDRLTVTGAENDETPNGSDSDDPTTGPGIWPEPA
ncbi:hypothetical protein [Actinoplanes sichuanensis]|nr:hypothetical protein [Actinoplanes sichuanensis]